LVALSGQADGQTPPRTRMADCPGRRSAAGGHPFADLTTMPAQSTSSASRRSSC